jgi:ABC-type Zn uptake system ZnuABC Zn-binding protein ZnuA
VPGVPSLRAFLTAIALAVLGAAAGCGDGPAGGSSRDAALRVVATTALAADLARQVGGDRVAVETLLPAGADPHGYEPRPSDARAVATADVVVRSGGDLDAWLSGLVDSAGGEAAQTTLIDAVRTIEGDGGETDPHWWQDPRNVVRATARLRAALSSADPGGRRAYARAADRYASQVRAADRAIAACMASVPASRRKLVTGHDAFGYLADRYDIDVLGSIVPALSSSAQPSAGDVRRLVAAIRRGRVRTVFPERGAPPRLERAIAREAGVRVGPPLFADALGPPGSEGATYLGALRHDAAAIAAGFGARCDL